MAEIPALYGLEKRMKTLLLLVMKEFLMFIQPQRKITLLYDQ